MMRDRYRRRIHGRFGQVRLLALAILPLLVLSGCSGIPDSGTPQRVDADGSGNDNGTYVVNASGPVAGASPSDIVSGFVQASADTRSGYSVAREFLTTSFAQRWQPEAQVTVVDQGPQVSQQSSGSFAASGNRVAIVDADGRYLEGDGSNVEAAFTLEQEGGEWRISAAPDGIWITQSSFTLVFKGYPLAFLGVDDSVLVPDVRWFPAGDQVATRVITALLDGPSSLLAPGVRSAIPDGVRLSVDAVVVGDGPVELGLTSGLLQASPQDLRLAREQLLRTLQGVSDVDDLSIAVNGIVQSIAPLADAAPNYPSLADSRLMLQSAGRVRLLDETGSAEPQPTPGPVEQAATALSSMQPEQFVVSGGLAVALRNGAIDWARGDQQGSVPADVDGGISADSSGRIWYAAGASLHARLLPGGDDAVIPVQATGSVRAVQIAPDGVRLLVVVDDGTARRILVGTVSRDESGDPVSVGPLEERLVTDGQIRAMTWYGDDGFLAVLSENGAVKTRTMAVSGPSSDITGDIDITALAGGQSQASVRALAAGRIYSLQGSLWIDTRQTATAIAYAWE